MSFLPTPRGNIFSGMFSKLSVVLITLAATPPSLHADWKYSANRYDLRVASTEAAGTSPDGPIATRFVVQHSPAKDGTISMEFIVEGARKRKGFGYDAFEGPDAPAAGAKLTRIVIERPGAKPLMLLTKVGGWYLNDAFHFAATETNARPGPILEAVRAIQAGAAKVSVNVQDA